MSKALRDQHEHHHVRIPFPGSGPDKDAKYSLCYSKPDNINVVGSYGRRTSVQIGDTLVIDLAVTMPSDIFQPKDYLNYRYFYKRAYYLACVVAGIAEANDCSFKINFGLQNNHDLQPVIFIKPGSGDDDFTSSRCQIRIILAAHENLFPTSKTLPIKSSVRSKVEGDDNSHTTPGSPTPYYNAVLRSECSSLAYLKYLHTASLQSEGFANACILGSVWTRQRGLAKEGFGSFEWACTTALLLQGGGLQGRPILSKGYSSYQLFKALLQVLTVRDLITDPLLILCDSSENVKDGRPVIFDGVRQLNILFKMTQWSYEILRHEARHTLKLLSDPLADQFDACFIAKVDDYVRRFDGVVTLPLGESHPSASQSLDAVSIRESRCSQLYEALRKGLSDRVTLINLNVPGETLWNVENSRPLPEKQERVIVGLLFNPEQVNRTVDRGPPAEDRKAATAFQKFWGDRAELRRFKDGSIQETVTWSASDTLNAILKQMTTHIAKRHISDEAAEGIKLVGEGINTLAQDQIAFTPSPVAVFQPIMSAFETLEKSVRSLEGLPLQIRQISAADPLLRYASVKTPILESIDTKMDPVNVHVQFEGSSRWPDDLIAVQRTKMAFLIKMGELFEELNSGLSARLGLENTDQKLLNAAFLDIVYPNNASFRIRIHHEREQNLLEQSLKTPSHITVNREEVAIALSTYKRNFIQAPLHTQAIRTLSTRHVVLSPTMRLLKVWRDSHLLSYHISDELIELLTVHTFVHPYPWPVPGSLIAGFLRTLTFISKWNWRSEPLIIDFNGEMNSQEIEAIETRFEAWRKVDPAMNRVAMFVASNVDRDGTTWTEGNPMKVVAARLSNLAKAACRLIREQGLDIQPQALFAPSFADYDFIVHLNPKFTEDELGQGRKSSRSFKNLQIQNDDDRGMTGINPIQCFVDELRRVYRNNILFFHNVNGGSVIGGLWNPQAGPRTWKINTSYSTMPSASIKDGDMEAQIEINRKGTLHELARLGGDMISRIEIKR